MHSSSIMANDYLDSRRKHPHSPSDDDSQDRSKRHKHRHRHHHHSRHRRHRHSKNNDDERRGIVDAANNGDDNVGVVLEQIKKIAVSDNTKADSDMEEGEIIEDEAIKEVSDSESGEIRAFGAPSGSNTRVDDDDLSLVDDNGKPIGELKSLGNGGVYENNASGEIGYELNKTDKVEATFNRRSHSPVKGKNKEKGLSSADFARLDISNRLSQSPSHVRYQDEGSHRSRSKSPSFARRKSHESKEKYKDRKTRRETKITDRDHEEERRHHERDRESGRIREIKKEIEDNRKREKRQERSRDGINDGEFEELKYRRKEYRSSRARDLSRRGYSPPSHVDRDMERELDDRDRLRDVSERHRDNGNDRRRGKDRDVKSDSINRHYGHGDEDRYGDHGRSHDSKHRVNDSEDYHRNSRRIRDSEKDCSSRGDFLKQSELKVYRNGDSQDDYPENMELELVDQEEEDINRIKEESRKRREAILQKYRTKELQKKVEPQVDTAGKGPDKEISGEPSGVLLSPHSLQGSTAEKVSQAFSMGKSPSQNETSTVEQSSGAVALGEGTPKSERSNDMFCDDIFGDSLDGVRKTDKGDGVLVERSGLHDNWDDPEGYYGYRLGEILDGRYEITAAHGKGVFSTVVRAKDLKVGNGDPEEVAIKIIRSNDTMLKAGMEELVILKKLVGADPDDRRHCVRYISSFKYRNHLCLVFESLNMNLREVLKKFGRNIGLKLTAVRAYSKQLFIALKHLRNCGVLHCDIKPDNMLVNDAKNVLKLCDFGNAMFAGKNEVTPYLVSRFYRAPEIVLGLTYDHPLDMWSVGCCLYEFYSGKVLFPGPTNNDMLRLHMELKGPFPKKMLRKGAFCDQHFDQDLNFLSIEEDVVTKKIVRRLIVNIKPKDIGTIIKGSPGEDPKMLANFKDLLDKIFVLDPDKRLTVSQALNHPFITGK